LQTPSEIDGLRGLILDRGISNLDRALMDPQMDMEESAARWRNYREVVGAEADYEMPNDLSAPSLLLFSALHAAEELWLAQGNEIGLLRLILLIARPDGQEIGLSVEADNPAFVIRPGSLLGGLFRGSFRTSSWLVCLVLGGGTTPSARRADMVSRLRQTALTDARVLQDIHDLAGPPRDRPLVVLIHGLFATDVGTFGALQPLLEQHFEVVGFPHDTLSKSIGSNGFDLAALLGRIACEKVHLVAHSRGGLVARSTVSQLQKHRPGLKIRSCVTFGTPHLGAELAENPGSLIASIALLKASIADKSIASLVDMLSCVSEGGDFPGIRDLCPASTSDTWLAKLQTDEGLYPDERFDLFAVGGTKHPDDVMQLIAEFGMNRLIGNSPSDLVVRKDSSLPLLGRRDSQTHSVSCDHFGYFRSGQETTLKQAVNFLLSR
jgi:pimeloyl-ACP methyl ester carboxylesterase